MDVDRQIEYWRQGAQRALRSVPTLEEHGYWLEALFWTHLAVEKALKAHVVKTTRNVPPYIHNLSRLADIAGFDLYPEQLGLCEQLRIYQRVSRYPDETLPDVEPGAARSLLEKAREFYEWLLTTL